MDNFRDAPYILWLIREGQVQSVDALMSHFAPVSGTARFSREAKINKIVDNLIAAGLVVRNKKALSPTPLIEKMQVALDISLRDMLNYDPNSVSTKPIFGKPHSVNPKSDIFVVMPFSENLRPVYDDHIKPVSLKLDFTIARADDFFAAHSIISDVWSGIYNSKIIIADCTGRNPNVFYEIGIAHTIGRPTIVISQQIEDVPFDLRHLRCIIYQYNPRGMTKFNESLAKALETEKAKFAIGQT